MTTTADRPTSRRAFTLIELLVASMIGVLVLGSLTVCIAQVGRAKNIAKTRFDAHLRGDAALRAIRADVVSVIRDSDLFWTRLRIEDDTISSPLGDLDRDELLLFGTRLRAIRDDLDYQGEGLQYETQYRVDEDDAGPALWQRRDMLPDEYPEAGGIATPIADGIVGLRVEAFDGLQWDNEWDSDDLGLPHAIRITVMASGHRDLEDVWTAPVVHFRTVVPIDRVPLPIDILEIEDLEEEQDGESDEETEGEGDGDDEGAPSLDDVLPGQSLPPDASGGGGGSSRGGSR